MRLSSTPIVQRKDRLSIVVLSTSPSVLPATVTVATLQSVVSYVKCLALNSVGSVLSRCRVAAVGIAVAQSVVKTPWCASTPFAKSLEVIPLVMLHAGLPVPPATVGAVALQIFISYTWGKENGASYSKRSRDEDREDDSVNLHVECTLFG